jgi:hypothetical protein
MESIERGALWFNKYQEIDVNIKIKHKRTLSLFSAHLCLCLISFANDTAVEKIIIICIKIYYNILDRYNFNINSLISPMLSFIEY